MMMKYSTATLLSILCSAALAPVKAGQGPCVQDNDSFEIDGCDYDNFVEGLQVFLDEETTCDHDAKTELRRIYSTTDGAKRAISQACSSAWNSVSTSSFHDVDPRFNNGFMNRYVAGETFLNTETGSFQDTTEGNNIDDFRDNEATNTIMRGFPSLSRCEYNSIMCCFGRDRQPNDDNGNCAEPLDENCLDADPADNSNLCWLDTDHIPSFSDPFAFPNDSEGDIHCHGLAWADDDNHFSSQLRFNNFFYVSLYDHMYTRGYVQPTQDSENIGMCGCIEEMPKVSRADCTEIAASASFSVSFSGVHRFQVSANDDLDVEFNACQGINPSNGNAANNDLASYVYRLHIDGEIDGNAKDKAFETLVGYDQPGNNNNEAACEAAYEERFGPYPDEVEDTRCSPSTALFKIDNVDNTDYTSLEECQAKCQNTQGCNYFSLGVDTGNDDFDQKGVCYGCQANVQGQDGFNTWELTKKTSDPTCSAGVLASSGKFCCAESCGSCGGGGCSQRPGGADACCVQHIARSGVSCAESSAPCIV